MTETADVIAAAEKMELELVTRAADHHLYMKPTALMLDAAQMIADLRAELLRVRTVEPRPSGVERVVHQQ